jgi:ribosomal protein L40E
VGGPEAAAGPTEARRSSPLTGREKRTVVLAALAPVAVAVVVLAPVAALTSITVGDVVGAAVVYGGLLGLAAGFVATDRLQARQCPRCGARHPRGDEACDTCGYDLLERPRYACEERHLVHLDRRGDGCCPCGRQLEPLPTPRGVGPQVVATLKIGGLLLVFLVTVGVVLNVVEGRL